MTSTCGRRLQSVRQMPDQRKPARPGLVADHDFLLLPSVLLQELSQRAHKPVDVPGARPVDKRIALPLRPMTILA